MLKSIIIRQLIIKNMKMKSNLFKFFLVTISCFNIIVSQETENDNKISIQEITIIKSYNPSLKDVFKVPETIYLLDTLLIKKNENKYNVLPVPVLSTFKPNKGEPLVLKFTKKSEKFNSLLNMGFGNFNHILLDYSSGIKLDRLNSIDWIINFDGILKKNPITVFDSSKSNSLFNISHSFKSNSLWSISQINFHQNKQNFHGIRSIISDPLIIEKTDTKQNLGYLSIGSNWNWFNSLINEVDFNIFFTSDSYQSSEFEFDLNSIFKFSLLGMKINLSPSINYFSNQFSSEYYSNLPTEYFSGKSSIKFDIISIKNKLKFKIGLIASKGLSNGFEENNFFVFPNFDFAYFSSNRFFNPYGKIEGNLELNNYRKFTHNNPFTSPGIIFEPNVIPLQLIFGNSFMISKIIELDLNGFYMKSKSHPFFRNFGYDNSNFDFTSFRYGNSFEVIYDELESYGFEMGLKVIFKANDYVNMNIIYRDLKAKEISRPWNLSNLKMNFSGNMRIINKLYAQWKINYIGKRYNSFRDNFLLQSPEDASEIEEELKPFIYSDLRITQVVNERWNVFIKAENIFNQKSYEWANYKSYGSQFLFGLSYNFNFNY